MKDKKSKAIGKRKDDFWNEQCPNCDSKDLDWEKQDEEVDGGLYVVTCQQCDASFEVIEDKRYWLKRYTDEPKRG